MENQQFRKNNRLYHWLISGLIVVMLACSSLSTPMTNLPGTTQEIIPYTPNEPGRTPVSVNNEPVVDFLLIELNVLPSESGWIPYEAKIAIQNKKPLSIYFAEEDNDISNYRGNYLPNLQIVRLYSDASYIVTSEGNQYPIDYTSTGPSVVIIPGGFTISAFGGREMLKAYYRVPELLHPTQLVISPGLVYEGGVPVKYVVDIVDNIQKPQSPLSALALENLPANIRVGANINVTVDSPIANQVNYFWDEFSLLIEFTIQNEDITGDTIVDLEYFIIDDIGQIYPGDALPKSIGPGQTESVFVKFALPPEEAFGSRKLYLRLINTELDTTYSMQIQNLPNCVLNEDPIYEMASYYDPTEMENIKISIPGSISGQIESSTIQRIYFDGTAGTLLHIVFTIISAGEGGSLMASLYDPSAWELIQANISPNNKIDYSSVSRWIPDSSRVPILCNGRYSIYFLSLNYDRVNYEINISEIEIP